MVRKKNDNGLISLLSRHHHLFSRKTFTAAYLSQKCCHIDWTCASCIQQISAAFTRSLFPLGSRIAIHIKYVITNDSLRLHSSVLSGGSSGAITYSAIQAAKEYKLGAGKKVVVILPDGIRNYMTKFVSDQWMEAHLFKEPPEREFLYVNLSQP